ncbi:MAG: AbgT family transporter [Prolixibacteraceae bacterium]|jgi:aminobenzoyl-glutamate transport protein|nr:AbgT family transporter [Prolixibacteraceae bacterium]
MERQKRSRRILTKILNWTERAGNALPHPATLFALTALLLSALGHFMGWEVIQYFVYMK